MERDEIWDTLKDHAKSKFDADRKKFLSDAIESDDKGWIKHTEFHWSRYVAGERVDYWPSRKKFLYRGKIRRGDVMKFIAKKETP
jgi:hypothetical protein